jgi:hypothetical protein
MFSKLFFAQNWSNVIPTSAELAPPAPQSWGEKQPYNDVIAQSDTREPTFTQSGSLAEII